MDRSCCVYRESEAVIHEPVQRLESFEADDVDQQKMVEGFKNHIYNLRLYDDNNLATLFAKTFSSRCEDRLSNQEQR